MTSEELDAKIARAKTKLRPISDNHWSVEANTRAHCAAMAKNWKALAKIQSNLLDQSQELIETLLTDIESRQTSVTLTELVDNQDVHELVLDSIFPCREPTD
jgi:hypothetical protein